MFLNGVVDSATLPETGGTTQYRLRRLERTVSATEPKRKRSSPDRSLVPSTIRSALTGGRMQQNHAGRIAVLDTDFKANSRRFGGVAQCPDQGGSLLSVPIESSVCRHGVQDCEFGVMQATQRNGMIESGPRGFGEVDCGENTTKFGHDNYSFLKNAIPLKLATSMLMALNHASG